MKVQRQSARVALGGDQLPWIWLGWESRGVHTRASGRTAHAVTMGGMPPEGPAGRGTWEHCPMAEPTEHS